MPRTSARQIGFLFKKMFNKELKRVKELQRMKELKLVKEHKRVVK